MIFCKLTANIIYDYAKFHFFSTIFYSGATQFKNTMNVYTYKDRLVFLYFILKQLNDVDSVWFYLYIWRW